MVGNSHPCISEGDWWQVSRKQDMDGGNLLSSNNGKKYSLSSKFFKSVFNTCTIFWSMTDQNYNHALASQQWLEIVAHVYQ